MSSSMPSAEALFANPETYPGLPERQGTEYLRLRLEPQNGPHQVWTIQGDGVAYYLRRITLHGKVRVMEEAHTLGTETKLPPAVFEAVKGSFVSLDLSEGEEGDALVLGGTAYMIESRLPEKEIKFFGAFRSARSAVQTWFQQTVDDLEKYLPKPSPRPVP